MAHPNTAPAAQTGPDPKLAAEGLSFTPPGTPPLPLSDVPAGELLETDDAPATDGGSFAPPPMPSETAAESRA